MYLPMQRYLFEHSDNTTVVYSIDFCSHHEPRSLFMVKLNNDLDSTEIQAQRP